MRSRNAILLFLVFVMIAAAGGSPASSDTPYPLPADQQIIQYLTDSIEWYRQFATERKMATEPDDLLYIEDIQPVSTQILQLSFEFAKADASLAAKSQSPADESTGAAVSGVTSSDFEQFARMEADAKEAAKQTALNLESLQKALPSAHGAEREKVKAAIADTQSRIQLLQARASGLKNLVDFVRSTVAGQPMDSELGLIIDSLERSVPEAANMHGVQIGSTTQNTNSPSVAHPTNLGILGMISEVSRLGKKLRTFDQAIQLTNKLAQSSKSLHAPLAAYVRRAVQSESVETSNLQSSELGVLQQEKTRLDALTLQVTSLSPAMSALDKQQVLLVIYRSHLGGWRTAVLGEDRKAWMNLLLRLAILGVLIASMAGIALALERATARYVHDANRRRIFLVTQRIGIWFAIILVAAFSLASDLGSLATYLGLLSAGVAVAMQNVILAVLGYFLLAGKRGIKVGDRVSIGGVSGEIINIGLLQFQLEETDQDNGKPTRRVTTFSNSYVFVSPATGLSKFVPDSSTAA